MPREKLTEKQVKIVRDLRSLILNIVIESGKTPGKMLRVAEIYEAIAKHFSVSVNKIVQMGNELVWTALYLIELQGWVRVENTQPRVRILRVPKSEQVD